MIERKEGAVVEYKCQRFPPHCSLMAAQGPKTPGNPAGVYVGTRGDFPPVNPSMWCGEWAEAETGLLDAAKFATTHPPKGDAKPS